MRGSPLPRVLLGVYVLLVAYASLYPLQGWRGHGLSPVAWLTAPLPDYVTGFDVAVNGVRDAAMVDVAVESLVRRGAEVCYCRGDVAVPADRQAIVDAVQARFGRLDVLVNNAGVAPNVRADILEASEESFDRVIGINLKGPYFLTQLVARFARKRHALIVNHAIDCLNSVAHPNCPVATPPSVRSDKPAVGSGLTVDTETSPRATAASCSSNDQLRRSADISAFSKARAWS